MNTPPRRPRHTVPGALRASLVAGLALLAPVALGLVLTQGAPLASAATPRDPEHRRIAEERAAANALFAERERACNRQFVVTACVETARREQRAALARLHQEQLALDEAQRRQTADARRQAAADKADAQASRADAATPASSSPPSGERARRAPSPNPGGSSASADRSHHSTATRASEAARRAQEARHEAEFDANAKAARAHRETVERRNAERAASGKAVPPLPVPIHAPTHVPTHVPSGASAAGR